MTIKGMRSDLRRKPVGDEQSGSSLVLRRGPAATMIAELARETQAGAVFWNEIAQARIRR